MKKLLSVISIAVLALCLTACSKATPSSVCENMLKAVQKRDVTAINKYYIDEMDESDFELSQTDGMSAETADKVLDFMVDFDFKIINEKISDDGSTAYVTVTYVTHDFTEFTANFLNDYVANLFSAAFSNPDLTDADILKIAEEALVGAMADNPKETASTTEIKLVKDDKGEWKVADMNEQTGIYSVFVAPIFDEVEEFLQRVCRYDYLQDGSIFSGF